MKTLAEMRQIVRDNTQRQNVDVLSDTRINSEINSAIRGVSNSNEWRQQVRTSEVAVGTGDLSFPIPAGAKLVTEIRINRSLLSYPVLIIPETEFHRINPMSASLGNGLPQVGYIQGGTVFFGPPANDDLSFFVTTLDDLPQLTTDLATLPWDECDEAVISWATAAVYRMLQMYKDSMFWDQRYKEELGMAISNDRIQPVETRIMSGNRMNLESGTPWLDPFYGLDRI